MSAPSPITQKEIEAARRAGALFSDLDETSAGWLAMVHWWATL
jgi:hypothetical protein